MHLDANTRGLRKRRQGRGHESSLSARFDHKRHQALPESILNGLTKVGAFFCCNQASVITGLAPSKPFLIAGVRSCGSNNVGRFRCGQRIGQRVPAHASAVSSKQYFNAWSCRGLALVQVKPGGIVPGPRQIGILLHSRNIRLLRPQSCAQQIVRCGVCRLGRPQRLRVQRLIVGGPAAIRIDKSWRTTRQCQQGQSDRDGLHVPVPSMQEQHRALIVPVERRQ